MNSQANRKPGTTISLGQILQGCGKTRLKTSASVLEESALRACGYNVVPTKPDRKSVV